MCGSVREHLFIQIAFRHILLSTNFSIYQGLLSANFHGHVCLRIIFLCPSFLLYLIIGIKCLRRVSYYFNEV